jgi:SAM-dependent methyltransferase
MALSENEIRPADLEAGKLRALRADLERLSQRKRDFVSVDCPACFAKDGHFEFEKFGFRFDRCVQCGTVYMNPRAAAEDLADFYSGSVLYEYWDKYIFPASRTVRKERIFRPRVKRILELCSQHGVDPGLLVEVGSASGMFCEEALASRRFSRVVGIEPSAEQAQTCREIGIEVIETTLEGATNLPDKADVVASFETIEHVFSPRDFLSCCHTLLGRGGLLVLTCPNYEGFDILTLGPLSESLDAEHINMFNPRSLRCVVQSSGFEVVECTTPGKLDAELVRKKAQEGLLSLEEQPFLQKVLIDDWDRLGSRFQDFLAANLLSSHMWLVARKAS